MPDLTVQRRTMISFPPHLTEALYRAKLAEQRDLKQQVIHYVRRGLAQDGYLTITLDEEVELVYGGASTQESQLEAAHVATNS